MFFFSSFSFYEITVSEFILDCEFSTNWWEFHLPTDICINFLVAQLLQFFCVTILFALHHSPCIDWMPILHFFLWYDCSHRELCVFFLKNGRISMLPGVSTRNKNFHRDVISRISVHSEVSVGFTKRANEMMDKMFTSVKTSRWHIDTLNYLTWRPVLHHPILHTCQLPWCRIRSMHARWFIVICWKTKQETIEKDKCHLKTKLLKNK